MRAGVEHVEKVFRIGCLALAVGIFGMAVATQGAAEPAEGSQSEMARLKAENAKLRQQVEALKEQRATRPAGVAASQPAKGVMATRGVAGAGTQPTTKESGTVVRVFTSMPEVLARLPLELRPQPRRDWFTFNEGKFIQWWKEQLAGMSFDLVLPFEEATVQRSASPAPGAEWVISFVRVGGKSFTALGADHRWSLDSFTLKGNDVTAKYWMNLKRGTLLRVKGTIKNADIGTYGTFDMKHFHSYEIRIHLQDAQVIAP
jgi:hypothetical protein